MTTKPIAMLLDHLEGVFEAEPRFLRVASTHVGLPNVTLVVYRDVPARGHLTGVTFGLSVPAEADPRHTGTEIVTTVATSDEQWPVAVTAAAERMRASSLFLPGDTIRLGRPLIGPGGMDALLVHEPRVLDAEDCEYVDLGSTRVNITGLFPVHAVEIPLIAAIGADAFLRHPDLDEYDVGRPPVTRLA